MPVAPNTHRSVVLDVRRQCSAQVIRNLQRLARVQLRKDDCRMRDEAFTVIAANRVFEPKRSTPQLEYFDVDINLVTVAAGALEIGLQTHHRPAFAQIVDVMMLRMPDVNEEFFLRFTENVEKLRVENNACRIAV